jgi:hypothetical protein
VKTGWKRGYRAAIVAASALLVAGGAAAVAQGAHGRGKAAVAKRHVAKRVVRSGVHADVSLIRADKSTDSFSVDRGWVTASSATSLTLHRADGNSVTVSLSSNTVVRGRITVGRAVLVFSRGGAAFRVRAPGAGVVRPLQAATAAKSPVVHLQASFVRGDGSTGSITLDRGQVTSSSSTALTIERADGVSVTFAIRSGAVTRGQLATGQKVVVLSRGGAVVRVLARGFRMLG